MFGSNRSLLSRHFGPLLVVVVVVVGFCFGFLLLLLFVCSFCFFFFFFFLFCFLSEFACFFSKTAPCCSDSGIR